MRQPNRPFRRHLAPLIALLLIAFAAGCGGGGQATTVPGATITPIPTVAITPAPTVIIPTIGATPRPTTVPTLTGTQTGTDSWLQVYFTDPAAINPERTNGIDQIVIKALNEAKTSIDIASFDFNLKAVVDALAAAKKRGVSVRLVLDTLDGNLNVRAIASQKIEAYDAKEALSAAKLAFTEGGRSSGLMHNKIVIIDGRLLYVGSWNLSFNDTYNNNNNLLEIRNPALIANYQAKFNEMYVEAKFGRQARVGAMQPSLTIDGTAVNVYFAPVDKVMEKVVAEVKNSRRSIRFMIFTFTHADLSGAIIERMGKGVTVQGVIESRGASQGAMPTLVCAKVPVRVEGGGGTMHHKVIIIDNEVVITGSFNFTKSATEQNDENLLIIRNKRLAQAYIAEFDKMWALSSAPANVTCP
ncbi:MAG TPA: phospholipase D-like domain-containing protein [Aggregatilineales bacterium]|nr:DUF1669 domain-containing protein [Anaerolineales bacterium]HRE48273.1 phospholipase D-like domain-containing protein [Aggregatilineales bacterium]